MARAIWSGSISFGLINIPVKLFAAVRDRSIRFHLLSSDGECRLRRKLVCPETGEEFDFNETARGYEIAPDQYVLISDEELDALRPESGRTIDIASFVDLEEIDPMLFDRPYYLLPEENGAKPYRLLAQALGALNRVAISRFVMRDKEYLAALRSVDNLLLLETMRFADEVVQAGELDDAPKNIRVSERELEMADRLIESLTTPFDPATYRDEFRTQVRNLIDQKAAGREVISREPKEQARSGKVIDLMDALRQSLADVKRQNGAEVDAKDENGKSDRKPAGRSGHKAGSHTGSPRGGRKKGTGSGSKKRRRAA